MPDAGNRDLEPSKASVQAGIDDLSNPPERAVQLRRIDDSAGFFVNQVGGVKFTFDLSCGLDDGRWSFRPMCGPSEIALDPLAA